MEMLHYDFMQRAFCAGGIIALLASALGVYLMLRRQALMADMLSHVSLAGVAAGALLHLNPAVTGFTVAVIGATIVEFVRRSYRTYSEISIAIVMVGGLFFYALRRPLYEITFDEETAKASGVPVRWISFSFSILTGMIVSAAMPIVGVLLVSALIVLPAALAIRIAPSFTAAVLLSMLFGLTGVCSGLTASYKLSTPPGGTIALVLLFMLVTGILLKKAWLKASKIRNKKVDPFIPIIGGNQE